MKNLSLNLLQGLCGVDVPSKGQQANDRSKHGGITDLGGRIQPDQTTAKCRIARHQITTSAVDAWGPIHRRS